MNMKVRATTAQGTPVEEVVPFRTMEMFSKPGHSDEWVKEDLSKWAEGYVDALEDVLGEFHDELQFEPGDPEEIHLVIRYIGHTHEPYTGPEETGD